MSVSEGSGSRSRKSSVRKTVVGLLIVAVSSVVIFMARSGMARLAESHQVKIPPASPTAVRALTVTESVISAGQSFSGVVRELRRAELSFRVGGTVQNLLQVPGPEDKIRDLHEGDVIPAGKPLALLDPADYSRDRDIAAERLAGAESRLKQAIADRDEAESAYRRTENLAANKATTQAALDASRARRLNSQAAIEVAEREIAAARIALKQAEENLAYCTLTAPFEQTTIARRSVDQFQRVQSGQPVFVVTDLSSVVVAFAVQDSLLCRLQIGDRVEVTAEGLDRARFSGVIHKIGAVADDRSRSYPVEVRIDDPQALRPGMIATVHFEEEKKAALIPLSAVVLGENRQPMVYRIQETTDGLTLQMVPVQMRDVLDNQLALQLEPASSASPSASSLRLGDRIVQTGVHRLKQGEQVVVLDQGGK